MVFINPQNFGKIGQKMLVFLQQNVNFWRFSGMPAGFRFKRKVYGKSRKWSKIGINWYKCTLGSLLQSIILIFGYLVFWPFYGTQYVPRGTIFGKNRPKSPKIYQNSPPWHISGPLKWPKHQISKNQYDR